MPLARPLRQTCPKVLLVLPWPVLRLFSKSCENCCRSLGAIVVSDNQLGLCQMQRKMFFAMLTASDISLKEFSVYIFFSMWETPHLRKKNGCRCSPLSLTQSEFWSWSPQQKKKKKKLTDCRSDEKMEQVYPIYSSTLFTHCMQSTFRLGPTPNVKLIHVCSAHWRTLIT